MQSMVAVDSPGLAKVWGVPIGSVTSTPGRPSMVSFPEDRVPSDDVERLVVLAVDVLGRT